MPVYKRDKIIHKAADLLLENIDEIDNILVLEIAKDIKSARAEVERTADYLRYKADVGKNRVGEWISG
ncbi:aldehyde dehydrogenase family protein [Clostridioides difficile]|uniref:aldehyde dehydrogenase family protein n=1 Tax=Clostridioides difficile TaxID=1496 RepID=UPI0031B64B41